MRVATLRNARTRIKFCGITSPEDVAIAVDAGADAVGIIVAESERRVSLERAAEIAQAVPPFVTGVGVIGDDDCDAPALQALGLTLQFAGPAAPARCARLSGGMLYVKVFHVGRDGTIDAGLPGLRPRDYARALCMLDSSTAGGLGGSGTTFPWDFAAALARERPIIVAGGLTPENVGACVLRLRPYGVDVRSGVERGGRKDAGLMRDFVSAVREADAAT
jgi:phosphoribosylanthranilate isomerase